jgi:hypothetical protein
MLLAYKNEYFYVLNVWEIPLWMIKYDHILHVHNLGQARCSLVCVCGIHTTTNTTKWIAYINVTHRT